MQPGVTLPTAGQNNAAPVSSPVTGQSSGQSLLKNPELLVYPTNQDFYTVGPSTSTPYLITYIASTQFFIVELIQEPIGQARLGAEQYLERLLGKSPTDLCKLNYSVSVPNSINTTYAGDSLGFSACPGATKLPQ